MNFLALAVLLCAAPAFAARPQPSDAKLSLQSRKRFFNAYPEFKKRMDARNELYKLRDAAEEQQRKAREQAQTAKGLSEGLARDAGSDPLAREAAQLVAKRASDNQLLAEDSFKTAERVVEEYDQAYARYIKFIEAAGKVLVQIERRHEVGDPVNKAKVEALVSRLLKVTDRRDLSPKVAIIDKCAPNAPCRPTVVASAAPGWIFVEKAYLETNPCDAELAFMLAHEIGHLDAYHAAQTISNEVQIAAWSGDETFANESAHKLATKALIARQKVPQEYEADELGKAYLQKAMPQYAVDGPDQAMRFLAGLSHNEKLTMRAKFQQDKSLSPEERKKKEEDILGRHAYTADHASAELRRENLKQAGDRPAGQCDNRRETPKSRAN